MFRTRIHGRGGQGVVTAAEVLSIAAFRGGHHAQAFPSFGSERTGAPVVAYCRIDDLPIRSRAPVVTPDAVIIQDPTLLHQVEVFAGLAPRGFILINTSHDLEHLGLGDYAEEHPGTRIAAFPASDLARMHLGRPVPNTVMLGGLAAMTGVVTIDDVLSALEQRFSGQVREGNQAAARAAYDYVANAKGHHAAAD